MNDAPIKNKRGFTFVEILLVIGLAALMVAVISGSLLRLPTQADLEAEVQKVIADIKNQQLKSMVGETSGTEDAISYGIKFDMNSYTIFRGTGFTIGNTSNFTVSFPSSIQISSNTFPSGEIVFRRISGEVIGLVAGQDSITLQNTISSATSTITINRYGAIIKNP